MPLGPEVCSHDHAGARKCKQRVSTSEYIGRIQLRPASSLAPDAIAHRQHITSETQHVQSLVHRFSTVDVKVGIWKKRSCEKMVERLLGAYEDCVCEVLHSSPNAKLHALVVG